jgi:hypothetical protein
MKINAWLIENIQRYYNLGEFFHIFYGYIIFEN